MKGNQVARQFSEYSVDDRLLIALTEHLKLPLLQIARQAELAAMTNKPKARLEVIEQTADSALRLLDNYLLSTKLATMLPSEKLEPVSISGILSETAHKLAELAKDYNCELEIDIAGKYEPVMAHPAGLEAALTSLGYVLIESQTINEKSKQKAIVKLAAHRGRGGIVAGLFTTNDDISSEIYQRARQLFGKARRLLPELTSSSGVGVFIADSLFESMSAHLRIAHHHKLTGLAATLAPSHQLELI